MDKTKLMTSDLYKEFKKCTETNFKTMIRMLLNTINRIEFAWLGDSVKASFYFGAINKANSSIYYCVTSNQYFSFDDFYKFMKFIMDRTSHQINCGHFYYIKSK